MAAPEPFLQRWLLPERPGLRQFSLALLAFLLPLAGVPSGREGLALLLALSLTFGAGLALAWLLLRARPWFALRPGMAVVVLLMGFASLLNLDLLPRWETALRAAALARALEGWSASPADPLPEYHTGERYAACVSGPEPWAASTPVPLRRWTPWGWRDACLLRLRRDGTVELHRVP